MVSIINYIDFPTYRTEIKKAIIARKDKIDAFNYPNDWAWLTYALSKNGSENNPLFKDAIDNLSRWALSDSSESQDRYLAPLGLCSYLTRDEDRRSKIISKIVKKLNIILQKDIGKFSVLNDPTQVFCITLGAGSKLLESQKNAIIGLCNKNLDKGPPVRRVFYKASLLELGKELGPSLDISSEVLDPSGVVSIVWFYEHYANHFNIDTKEHWKKFLNIKDAFTLDESIEEYSSIMPLSNQDLALLYEAISNQAQEPNPSMLFDLYPLHDRIKKVSENLFSSGSYMQAVFEATKVLESAIKEKSGISKSGRSLVQESMKKNNPQICFSELKTQSEQDEQEGLKLITEGIFAAFRNPKGHEPGDTYWGNINPYEALDQLITISYILKRIETASQAQKEREGDERE